MTAPSSGAQVRAPLLIYMVAGSYWCPSLHAGGLRVDPRAQEPGIAVRMTHDRGQCGFFYFNATTYDKCVALLPTVRKLLCSV